jgi:hypothetical protein
MRGQALALTDVAIRQAKPVAKQYKLTDGAGLYLLVTPAGGKLWRLKYRLAGKEKLMAFGAYPEVSLADARKRRDEAREQIAAGKDPSREKRRAKVRRRAEAMNTFAIISAEYCAKRKKDGQDGWAPATAKRSEYLLSRLNAALGSLPIGEIEPADILAAVRKIETKGTLESARRTLQLAGMVFRYAVATARLASDPTRDLRGALATPKVARYAAILEPVKVGELLRAIDGYESLGLTRLALQLAPHVFVRPGELRHARWDARACAICPIRVDFTPVEKMLRCRPIERIQPLASGSSKGTIGGRLWEPRDFLEFYQGKSRRGGGAVSLMRTALCRSDSP